MRGLTSSTKFFWLSGALSSPMPSQTFLPVLPKALIRTTYSPATGPRAASIAYAPSAITAPAVGPTPASIGTNEMSPASSGEPLTVTFPLTAPRLEPPQPAVAGTPTQTRATSHVRVMRDCSRETARLAPQKVPTTSPPAGEPSACQVCRVMSLVTKRTRPSPKRTWTPPGCRLRAETMLRRLLYAVCVPTHGASRVDTQSTSRNQSGLLVLGV